MNHSRSRKLRKSSRTRRGLTLIEVVVTATMGTMLLLGAVVTTSQVLKTAQSAGVDSARVASERAALDRVEELLVSASWASLSEFPLYRATFDMMGEYADRDLDALANRAAWIGTVAEAVAVGRTPFHVIFRTSVVGPTGIRELQPPIPDAPQVIYPVPSETGHRLLDLVYFDGQRHHLVLREISSFKVEYCGMGHLEITMGVPTTAADGTRGPERRFSRVVLARLP